MPYQKPEIAPLGQATELILGNKSSHLLERTNPTLVFGIPDSELDD